MRFPLLAALMMLLVSGAIDYYIYRQLLKRCAARVWSKIQLWSAVAFALLLVVLIVLPKREGDDGAFLVLMWVLWSYVTVYAAKLIFCLFDWLSLLPRLWHSPRWKWLGRTGIGAALIALALMWWGTLINRFNIRVSEVEIKSAQLPPAFDGFRIVQVSDLHVGTYGTDTAFMAKVVERINSLKPDMVVFTGDIVNRHTSELRPFVNTFARLKAPYGVYSILGNHDYGDYYDWPTEQAREMSMQEMFRLQQLMGWRLLRNDYVTVNKDADTLVLIGVENVGDPPFKVYGDLLKAYPTPGDKRFKILLSHNPAHWAHDISDHSDMNIALTLSGHTHAMQMTIGHFSPCVWRYPTWGGLYHDTKGQQLYVNIGIGTVGMPARIGATPEITLLTLRR